MAVGVLAMLAAAAQVGAQVASLFSRGQALRQALKPACRSLSLTAGSAFQSAYA